MKRWLILLFLPLLCGCSAALASKLKAHQEEKIRVLVAEYDQARSRNDLLSMCVKANVVSGAYVDLGDSGSAAAWDARRAKDCEAARVGLMGPQIPGSIPPPDQ